MDDSIVEQTQGLFAPLIKKPKMSAKLLNKPPFRFLHDVFSELTRSTGFAEGLYQEGELDAGSIKDKEAKLSYLQKMLDYVNAATGQEVPVKLGKVVAGLEPENTNALLQAAAQAATNPNVDRNAALRSALGLPDDAGGGNAQAAEDEARAAEEAAAAQAAEEERHRQEVERMQRQRQEEEEAARRAQEEARMLQQQQEQQEQEQMQAEQAAAQQEQQPPPPPQPEPASAPPLPPQHQEQPDHGGHNQEMAEPSNEMIPPSMRKALPARPTTARRAPPKLPTKEVKVTNRGPKEVVDGGSEVSTGITSGLITEDMDDDDDDDAEVDVPITAPLAGFDDKEDDVGVDEDGMHGKLVGDILAEKKQLQNEQAQQGAPEPQPEEQPQGIVIKKRRSSVETVRPGATVTAKPAAAAVNDVNKLRDEIQKLCQITNPLGKCIEYIQEDLEGMEKEHRMWKADSQTYAAKLDLQANNTESSLVPLQQELADQTEKAANLIAQINRVKASILHNDMTIHNLLRGVVGTTAQ